MTRQAQRRSVPERGWLPIHPTHYERLGVTEGADATEIGDTIARALAKATPLALAEAPDAQVPQAEHDLQLACEVLADPLRREVYDRYLARERGQAPEGGRRRVGRLVWLTVIAAVAALWLLVLLFRPTAAPPAKPAEAGTSAEAGTGTGAGADQAAPSAPAATTAQPASR